MRRRKALLALLTTPTLMGAGLLSATDSAAAPRASSTKAGPSGPLTDFNVLVADGASTAAAKRAVRAAGGTVTRSNAKAGLLTARAPRNGFVAAVEPAASVEAAAPIAVVGRAPKETQRKNVEKENARTGVSAKARKAAVAEGLDPLDAQLWGLRAVKADQARAVQPGDHRVRVGVIDTGVDGSHPDIAPNFDAALSRNFTTDIPNDPTGAVLDGPCEYANCVDPADHDDNGHGTHVAGTIAAAANGLGVSGIAPDVTLINVRAGQDSGYFFLQPTVDAVTYAGDTGIDVVNMSFYVDPWLYNCKNNPADTPQEQQQQRIIVKAMKRAMQYAHAHGVTQFAAMGNEHTDLGNPLPDASSPDYPADSAHERTIDNATCLSMPTEGPHAIGVGSYGPSGAKADYSNYGEHITVSAPGGYYRDYFGTPEFRTNANLILSTYPRNVGEAEGNIDPTTGDITEQGLVLGVQRDCSAVVCGYYQFLQGTSMATPHAVGVGALIVSQYGTASADGLTMDPDTVRRVLVKTAAEKPCPVPATVEYLDEGRDPSYTATCTGRPAYNSFYGHGSVDALAAVTGGASTAT